MRRHARSATAGAAPPARDRAPQPAPTTPLAAARAPAYGRRMDTDPGFDTLAYAQRLKAAGVEDKQAEAHAAAARDSRAGLATKTDLEHLATKADLANLEARLSGAMGVLTVAFAGIVGVIVKFL